MRIPVFLSGAFCFWIGWFCYSAEPLPWEVNRPIATVKRELYRAHPKPKVAMFVGQRYMGPGLELEETASYMSSSDTPYKPKQRRSTDNGRTWSDFEPIDEVITHVNGTRICWGMFAATYDPASKAMVAIWLRQTKHKGIYYNHCFIRLSHDNGRTWGEPYLLRYEKGSDFDPDDPFKKDFLEHNSCYPCQNICPRQDGSLLLAGSCCHVPDDAPDLNSEKIPPGFKGTPAHGRYGGANNFVGRWNAKTKKYDWTSSNVVWVPRNVSSRGLSEPAVAELKDGRLLTIYRCSNVRLNSKQQPGRKRYTISTDGGKTIGPPRELTYDDGTQFYSPSSYHRLIRHSQTGKLYWIGNLSPHPAKGNSPRYPLVIAEMDEQKVALKKNTVTLIDTRRDGESAKLQLSNFSLLENRETHALEILLPRLGADPKDFWGSDAYKYTLILVGVGAKTE
ncbi:MAG: sialidase family protein [Planctomycetia bacterium]|jgi:hypothetical protein